MSTFSSKSIYVLGICLILGLSSLGYFLVKGVKTYKQFDRSVTVKGLSQKEFNANIVLWPIKFTVASNDLNDLNKQIEINTKTIIDFLKDNEIMEDEWTIPAPSINDKLANSYSNENVRFRYSANQTINVYSKNVDLVRSAILNISSLNKKGILFRMNDYDSKAQYFFTKLNEVKPIMIEEATRKAREVALKFAKDSNSKLGKIKKARQGQFSISSRDQNTQHIKRVRVVSTVEYYLDD
ncbi:SIMPL domain-containing protein [Arcobacter sp. YIC-80]|uniref:SIMPL domain-containing protein n=1 Tax=Arcobacter sp. YIC-80 TaxID=3376683 RepID=UPI00384D2ADF